MQQQPGMNPMMMGNPMMMQQPGMNPMMQQPGMNPMMAGGMGMNPQMMQQQMQQQMHPQQMQQQMAAQAQNLPIDQRYLQSCHQILAAIVPENPNYKDQVGTVLFEYIQQLIGSKAPKVTGMLIDLPIDDIKLIMQDWSLLNTRVQQASELLDQQPGQ